MTEEINMTVWHGLDLNKGYEIGGRVRPERKGPRSREEKSGGEVIRSCERGTGGGW